MKTAVGYIRLSDPERNLEKSEIETSLVNQESEIRSYCQKHKYNLKHIYREIYITGDDPNRPQFNKMLNDAQSNTFQILIVRSLSRLTRSGAEKQEDYITLLGYFGVEVISMTEDVKNELNRFIYGFVHRLPIIMGRIMTKQMQSGKRAQHKAYIKAPYGYKNTKNASTYWQPDKRSETVKKAFEQAYKGTPTSQIAQQLKIPLTTCYKILRNINYVGIKTQKGYKSIIHHQNYIKDSNKKLINKKPIHYTGTHQPLITITQWLKLHPQDTTLIQKLMNDTDL